MGTMFSSRAITSLLGIEDFFVAGEFITCLSLAGMYEMRPEYVRRSAGNKSSLHRSADGAIKRTSVSVRVTH